MIPRTTPPVDPRDASQILDQFRVRRRAYVPAWNPPDKSAGAAIGQIFSRFLAAIIQRLNQAPAKDRLAFLDLLGLRLIPAQSARAPIVFQLSQGAPDAVAPAGTQVAAPPPPGSSEQVVFSTEEDAGIAAARLTGVVSLWPGRDQYIDHSADDAAGRPFTLFQDLQLRQTDHILYLAHSTCLALAGTVHLKVAFDLAQGSSSPLDVGWQYWDGQVWRGFMEHKPSCLNPAEPGHDGTHGLSTSGSVQLDAEGAQIAPTTINGVQSYWIRGQLRQSLLPDPSQLLPEAETIRLRTQIDRRLELNLTATFSDSTGNSQVTVLDESGQPLDSTTVAVTVTSVDNPVPIPVTNGRLPTGYKLQTGEVYQFNAWYRGISGTTYAQYNLLGGIADITLVVKVEGLLPDKAYGGGKTLDTTKAFYPLGPNPTPGACFYFKQNEVFGKPGAIVQIYLEPAVPAPSSPLPHAVNWEYWNGNEWTLLAQSSTSGEPSKDFTVDEVVQLTVPPDMVSTKVNNEDGLWIRARLASGAFGFTQNIQLPPGSEPPSLSYTQPQPPAVAVFRMGYSWTQGPYPPEQVFTYNDFQYQDHTKNALWPGTPFRPYEPIGDVTPAFYLGFDKQLPVNNFGIYLDIAEQVGAPAGPALIWEYWNGGGWQEVAVKDETQQLQLPGMITFLPPADSQALARFDDPLYWLRGRLKEDGPPKEATINNIHPNAVWASQWQTFTNSPLGASTGVPNQIFQFNQIPVLAGQVIEVQELASPRANTEWRTLVMQVVPRDPTIVAELEALLANEGPQTDIVLGDVHLVRDKKKRVVEVWIQWHERPNFFGCGPGDRCYVLDHASGRLFFGNADAGMIPPAGAEIRASLFRSGGGLAGNVSAGKITQLLGALSGIQGVTNPRAAEGGADGETQEGFSVRAPLSIRGRGRVIVLQDYETMAHEASAGVAVARAIPTRDPSGMTIPGWVTLIILPQSHEPRPMPSAGLREKVGTYLAERCPGDIAAGRRIRVLGPTYLPIDVTATLAPKDMTQAGTVEEDARKALANFLHPLYGGPDGQGWDLGRGVHASDIARALGNVNGVDYVEELALYVNGVLQGEQLEVSAEQIVVAGQFKLSLTVPGTI